jgi:hypothetical protein
VDLAEIENDYRFGRLQNIDKFELFFLFSLNRSLGKGQFMYTKKLPSLGKSGNCAARQQLEWILILVLRMTRM